MANIINEELQKFKSNVEPSIDNMSSSYTTLSQKLNEITNSNNAAKSGINSYYKSKNKDSVIGSLDDLNDMIAELNTGLTTYLQKIITDSSKVVDNVKKLEEINEEITKQENIISLEEKKEEPSQSTINIARSIISSKNAEFKMKSNEATSLLNSLKALDEEVKINIKNTKSTTDLSNLKYGKLERKTFVASNGTKVTYMIYVPDYGKEVEGLPINMYMHGSGMGANDVSRLNQSGLGRFISDKNIMPSGIVILPLAPSGKAYENKDFRDALAELPLKVAKEYKADTNRISLSGHSYGAIVGYKLINEHPNEFSAIVPISGSNTVTSAFKNVKVWAFHGTADTKTQNTSYSQASSAMKAIKQVGGVATMHAYKGWGHAGDGKNNIVVTTFLNEFEINGEKINPLEWAFKQSKA